MAEPNQESSDILFYDLFADHGLDDILEGSQLYYVFAFGISCRVFQILLKRYGIQYESLPVEVRLRHLRALSESTRCWSWEDLLIILPEAEHLEINGIIVEQSRTLYGYSLLHSFALGMAWNLARGQHNRNREQETVQRETWTRVICTSLRLDPTSLHYVQPSNSWVHDFAESSAFSAIFTSMARCFASMTIVNTGQLHGALQTALSIWITALSSCSTDLLAYGREERRLYEQGLTEFQQRWAQLTNENDCRFSLIGITYGPLPEHWSFWWSCEYEDYAGEFWEMIENQRIKLPGSWVEESADPDDVLAKNIALADWMREDPSPLIWSEYRKIRPPV